MLRPITTLFMLMSVDGKISTGDTDALDFDRDLPNIAGVREGLHQYYEIERTTDLFSLNTGRVMAKIGMNEKVDEPTPIECSFVILDSKPHLTEAGVTYLSKKVKKLILVTTNEEHPALKVARENLVVVLQRDGLRLTELLETLKSDFGCERLTIQSGGSLNAEFLHEGLVDHLSIVVAPLTVGGATTSTLVDGEANHTLEDLKRVSALKLVEVTKLEDSYVHLRYDVVHG